MNSVSKAQSYAEYKYPNPPLGDFFLQGSKQCVSTPRPEKLSKKYSKILYRGRLFQVEITVTRLLCLKLD